MKHILIFCLTLTLFACKNTPATTSEPTVSNEVQTEQAAPTADANPNDKPSMADAGQYVGKKPSEVDLFSKYNLEKRIEQMLKGEYQNFVESRTEESVINKDGEILYFVVCKASSCPANKYFVILDMLDTNVNVISIRGNLPKSYEESAIIGMTDKIANYFQRTLGSPKI